MEKGVQKKAAEKFLVQNGMRIKNGFRTVPGLVCIDLSLAGRKEAKELNNEEMKAGLENVVDAINNLNLETVISADQIKVIMHKGM